MDKPNSSPELKEYNWTDMERDSPTPTLDSQLSCVDDLASQQQDIRLVNSNTSLLRSRYLGTRTGRFGRNYHSGFQDDDGGDAQTVSSDGDIRDQYIHQDVKVEDTTMHQCMQLGDYSSSEHDILPPEDGQQMNRTTSGTIYTDNMSEPSRMYPTYLPTDNTDEPSRRPIGNNRPFSHNTRRVYDPRQDSFRSQSYPSWHPMDDVVYSVTPMEQYRPFADGTYMYPSLYDHRDPRRNLLPSQMYQNQWLTMGDGYYSQNSAMPMQRVPPGGRRTHSSDISPTSVDHDRHYISDGDNSPLFRENSTWSPINIDGTMCGNTSPWLSQSHSTFAGQGHHGHMQTESSIQEQSDNDEGIQFNSQQCSNTPDDGSRPCPMPGCNIRTKRPGKHLQQYHRMTKEASLLYRDQMKVSERDHSRSRSQTGRLVEKYHPCPICGMRFTRVKEHIKRKHSNQQGTCHSNDGDIKQTQLHSARSVPEMDHIDDTENGGGTGNGHQVEQVTDRNGGVGSSLLVENRCDVVQKDINSPNKRLEETEIDHDEEHSTSDENDEDSIVNTQTKYKVDKNVEDLLKKFGKWTAAPAGSSLSLATIRSYVPACGRCIEYLGGTIESIRNYSKIGEHGGLMDDMKKNKKMARTIRGSLYGMLKLMEYLMMKPDTNVFTEAEARKAHSTFKNYAASLRKGVMQEREERKRKAHDEVQELTPIIANYESTDHYKKAKALFTKAKAGHSVCTNDMLDMRAYLVTLLCRGNGNRTGVIGNCLVSEYRKGKQVGSDYQIEVVKHKTQGQGAAILVVEKQVWDELTVFVTKKQEAGNNSDYLFHTTRGTPLQSNNILGCVKRATGHKATLNNFRQMHVLIANEQNASPDELKAMAKHYGHSVKTQSQYYDVTSKRANAAKATVGMRARLEQYKACTL